MELANSSPQGDLIIDPTTTVTSSNDTYLQNATNYGSNTSLIIGKSAGTDKKRTIIKFNISGVPYNATVLNAQMKLRYYGTSGPTWVDRWVQAHELLMDWDEGLAMRDQRSLEIGPILWSAPYAALNGTDAASNYESTVLFQVSEYPVWKSWELTALAQKWVGNASTNNGVILWATNEDTDGMNLWFRSSEYSDSNFWPWLEIIWSQTPQTVYFLKDHLGSIRAAVLDSAIAPVIGYDDYDPWGYPLTTRTKAIPNAYLQGASKNKFTGKEYDDEFGVNLNYFGARYYDPQIGRWSVRDPLSEKYPSHSPYHYVLNNPARLIDLNGAETYVDSSGNVISDMTIWDPDDPSVFLITGSSGLMLLGELGGEVYADIIFENLLKQNVEYAEDLDTFLGNFKFANLVRPNGAWDYKNNTGTIWGLGNASGTTFIYKNTKMEAQDIGNFHFGATGKAAGYEDLTLFFGAGVVQDLVLNSKLEWNQAPFFGDDPRDWFWVFKGIDYHNKRSKSR